MYPRRHIVRDKELVHVFFRCHDRRYFFAPKEVKDFFLLLVAKNKRRYGIQVFEFILMDNHVHLLLRAPTSEHLSNFMRTVNSGIARFINAYFHRDSQAIRERFKSPIITTNQYLKRAMQYIWLNRYMVNRSLRPENDPYCSASWRIRKRYQYTEVPLNKKQERENLLSQLLDGYEKIDLNYRMKMSQFIRQWINEAISELSYFTSNIFENGHTIGDRAEVLFRGELLSAFKRCAGPP